MVPGCWTFLYLSCGVLLLLQIEGRGNGIKTNVVNNVEIAKALERPPDCKYQSSYFHILTMSGIRF